MAFTMINFNFSGLRIDIIIMLICKASYLGYFLFHFKVLCLSLNWAQHLESNIYLCLLMQVDFPVS